MSRLFSIVMLIVALCFVGISAEVIVSDNWGNVVGLPVTGGNATGGYTITQSAVSTSPYYLTIVISNIVEQDQTVPTQESFYMLNQFGNGTLTTSTFTAPNQSPVTGNYLGTASNPNTAVGTYVFTFNIPVGQRLTANITYTSTVPSLIDRIFLSINNIFPNIVGDPQFVGLRGQSYQVHGVDGAVYNIISEKETQVNSRFVFLSEGKCPIIDGVAADNCWSHPGSYLGELSFQQIVDGKVQAALVTAGSAKQGFSAVQVNGRSLKVGDVVSMGSSFSVKYESSHSVTVSVAHFDFMLSNSDMFVNQAVMAKVPVSKLTSHGLLGQTHSAKVYNTATRYIEGTVDDYVINDDDIFGTDFIYNQFQA